MVIKLRPPKRFLRSKSNIGIGEGTKKIESGVEIKWELRPGGMLVQKREDETSLADGLITIRVSTVSQWHDITIQSTSTFGELKVVLSMVTSLDTREQRLLFKGKEKEDSDYLHMVGVKDKDKVLLFRDPSIRDRELLNMAAPQATRTLYRTASV